MDKLVKLDELKSFCKEVFKAIGCSNDHAELATQVLVSADLRGVDSHGVARLSGYVRLWKSKRINSNPEIKIERESLSTATIDADEALGLISGPKAMELAIQKAEECGSGWVVVNNSNHFGIAGYHAMMALENDMIGIALTNASPLVSPTFSKDRLLGTNPIAIAIPSGKEDPFVLDMATTTAANGKLEVLQRKGKDAPSGWIQNKQGMPSTRADELKHGGSMLPLGGDREHGSHKGYGLGAMVDILSAVLSGANYGPWVPPFVSFLPLLENPVGKGIGHFFGAMKVDAFRDVEEFKHHMDNWIRTFKSSQSVDKERRVLIPGEPEKNFEIERSSNGIPIQNKVMEDLKALSEEFKIPMNL